MPSSSPATSSDIPTADAGGHRAVGRGTILERARRPARRLVDVLAAVIVALAATWPDDGPWVTREVRDLLAGESDQE